MTATDVFTPKEGPSFSVFTKLVATAGVGGVWATAWGARSQLNALSLPPDLLWLVVLAALVVAWQYLHILFSTTGISSHALSQGWLWRSEVLLGDIAQVKLLRFKPMDAWLSPRLVVRTRGLGSLTFHAADPAVLAALELLVHGPEEPAPQTDHAIRDGSEGSTP